MQREIDDYLDQRGAEGIAERSLYRYRKDLGVLLASLRRRGVRRWPEVTPADLDACMADQEARGVKQTTRASRASAYRLFFRHLQAKGRIVANPARDIPVVADRQTDLPQPPLEEAQVQAIFDALPRRNAIDLRNRAQLEVIYGCGLRLAESINLDLGDVDLSRRTLQVRQGKGGRDRTLPLLGGAAGALRDYLALRRTLLRGPDHGALFLSRRGKRMNDQAYTQWVGKIGQAMGLHLHPHLFRHSIAVHLLRGGADIRHIQQFLGHARLETTKVYLRLVPGRLKEDYEAAMPEVGVGQIGGGYALS